MPGWLAAAGAAWSGLALLDPRLGLPAVAGPAASLVGLALLRARRAPLVYAGLFTALAMVWAACAVSRPNMGADSLSYFVYLRSILFDGDLDFANDWALWGQPLRPNVHPVGPALLWAPAYLLAHGYVRALHAVGLAIHAPDGASLPYVRAAALTTGLVATVGASLLASLLRTRVGGTAALLAVSGALLASPIPYYLLVQPAMAHGLVFGIGGGFLWVAVKLEEAPSGPRWAALGALLGLAMLVRPQTAVYAVLPAALAIRDLRRRRGRPWWPFAAAACGALVFLPQMLVWRLLFGRVITVPQGSGFIDWRSPHLVDVLLSADRGLLTWTPLVGLGLLALPLARRDWPVAWWAGLVVAVASAWVNGGAADWAASDAFGARRFDLVVPFAALGLGRLLVDSAVLIRRRPLLVPAAVVAAFAVWNAGLMRLYRQRVFHGPAPLARVLEAQAEQLRRTAESGLEVVAGAPGRNLVYRMLVGEYLYENLPGGELGVASWDGRWLLHGWSAPRHRDGWPRFRWAAFPEACLLVALPRPFDLRGTVTARAPARLAGQEMAVAVNGWTLARAPLGTDWQVVPFALPARALVAGENRLCLRFAAGAGEEGAQVGAAVSAVALP